MSASTNAPLSPSATRAQQVVSDETAYRDFIAELVESLKVSVVDSDWENARINLTVLSEQVISALIERRDHDIRTAYDLVERCQSVLAVKYSAVEPKTPEAFAYILHGMVFLLATAVKHEKPMDMASLREKPFHQSVLRAIAQKDLTFPTKSDLLQELKCSDRELAPPLLELRKSGCVTTRWFPGTLYYKITSHGESLLDQL